MTGPSTLALLSGACLTVTMSAAIWRRLRRAAAPASRVLAPRKTGSAVSSPEPPQLPSSRSSEHWSKALSRATHKRAVYSRSESAELSERVVVAMVGLPARGKSYISKALIRYLRFIGCPAKIFNAGNKRRDDGKAGASASFFDPNNKDAAALKEQMAMETLDELLLWLRTETAGGAHEGEGGSCRRHSMLPTGCACGIAAG
jgi:6-phosphofructo-2-kinase